MLELPCKIWTGSKFQSGYGERVVDGKHKRVHRLAWEQAYGPIPPKMEVCHHCDTPACYELSHLFLGTHTENMRDAVAKGRMHSAQGEAHPMAKLTAGQVAEIRATLHLNRVGVNGSDLPAAAARYGVSVSAVRRVLQGTTWRTLRPAPPTPTITS